MKKLDRKNKKDKYLFSPSLQLAYQRKFEDDSLTNLQKQVNFFNGVDTVKTIKSTSFYQTVPGKKWTYTAELPFVIYHAESNTGWDFAIGSTFNNKVEDLYGRIGFYIPITTSADNVVIIEPIFKINKLNKSGLSFFQEQFAFGFNVSVSLAKFLTQ